MLKQLFSGLSILALATLGLSFTPAKATGESIVIDNVLALCQAVMAKGYWFDDSGTCDAYSDTQTSATLNRVIDVASDLVLKDLNLTFTRSNSPFVIHSGSVTIDGGYYTSPNCVVWIQYDNTQEPGHYDSATSITINSGIFEATVTSTNSVDSPSPVCLLTHRPVTATEADTLIAGYLPTGKRFVDVAPRLRATRRSETAIDITLDSESGYAHINKDASETNEVNYIKTTRVAVLGDIVEPEVEPEEEIEPEVEEEEETETEEEEEKLPKAPKTGVK